MEKPLERRVEGTFQTTKEAKEAVQRLLEEGYQTDEILLITNEDSEYENELETITKVDVDSVDVDDDDSFWDRIVEAFTFSEDDEDEASSLEEYGVREENAERFNEAIEANEIVLLVDSAAPRKNGSLSEVNEQVLENDVTKNRGGVTPMTDKKHEEIKEEKPTNVSTSETDNEAMEHAQDASQAQNARDEEDVKKDEANSPSADSENGEFDAESTEDEGTSLETTPELTGDEDTVRKDTSKEHRYQDNIAKGTVDGKKNDK